jgi:phosphoenolpyruvate carboxylase
VTESQDRNSASDEKAEVLKILTENLTASAKVVKRLLWSCERVADLLPSTRRRSIC